MANDPIAAALRDQDILIIDGALATELETRGCDLNDPLWSAKTLLESPEVIRNVHRDYFLAGANIAITASYQATVDGLATKGLSARESKTLIERSAQLALEAREEVRKTQPQHLMLVAGSVGPYGAFLADGSEYTGKYSKTKQEFIDFHRVRVEALVEAGVDLLACETIPHVGEVEALIELLEEYRHVTAWVSFTLRDARHISDGTALRQVIALLQKSEQIVAVGVNCVGIEKVQPVLEHLKGLTELPLLVYPNSGEQWDATTKTWSNSQASNLELADHSGSWIKAGAKLIGGCCRTSPQHIRDLRTTVYGQRQ